MGPALPELAGHLEGPGQEVALGLAEVGLVEPDVGLVEDAVEDEPGSPTRLGCRGVERPAVQQRAVAVGGDRGLQRIIQTFF